jgi:replicative DNA helicase
VTTIGDRPHTADPFSAMPAHDEHAEQAVIGACILSRAAVEDVAPLLGVRDFYRPANGEIYDAIVTLTMAGTPVDEVTIEAEMTRRGALARIGGPLYFHTCMQACPSAMSATYYADIVVQHSKQRRLREAGVRIVQLSAEAADAADVDAIIEHARQVVDDVSRDCRTATGELDLGEALSSLLLELDAPAPPSLPTGLHDLDQVLSGGLYPGQLVVIGARPGVGKSVVGLGWAKHAAKMGRGALFASLEMSLGDCTRRLVAGEANIELPRLIQHTLGEDDWRRAAEATDRMSSWPLYIDPRPAQTVTSIRAKARDITRTEPGLGIVVVDYLQLLSQGGRVRAERRDLEIGEWTRGLKLLAKELAVPVVAISQVGRGADKREDRRPVMSDLRESGSIEADADVVILLHRDADEPTEIEAIVAKQRQGPLQSVRLRWRGHYSRVDSIAAAHLRAV